MGLDGIELVLEFEDRFGIRIPDEAAGRCVTVGDCYALVTRLLLEKQLPTNRCATAHAFYRLRNTLMIETGMSRASLRPAVALEQVLPRGKRRMRWQRIQTLLQVRGPALHEAHAYSPSLFVVALACCAAAFLLGSWPASATLMLCAIGCFTLLIKQPWAREFPVEIQSVGDLARQLTVSNPDLFHRGGLPDSNMVWESVVHIISEQMGIAKEDIKPNSRLGDDLGID